MSLTITDNAVKKAIEIRAKMNKPDNWPLHIGLQGGGCSGFKYQVEFIEPPEDESLYRVIEKPGLKVLCDKKSYLFLIGTEIDYEESLMSSGFTFNSPKATRSCGCGESVGF